MEDIDIDDIMYPKGYTQGTAAKELEKIDKGDKEGDASITAIMYPKYVPLVVQAAKDEAAGNKSSFTRPAITESVPVFSSLYKFAESGVYKEAKDRISGGDYANLKGDAATIAAYEEEQKRLHDQGMGATVLRAAAHIPAIIGEAAMAAPVVKGLGLAPALLRGSAGAGEVAVSQMPRALGAAMKIGARVAGGTAAQTSMMPSMWLPQAQERAISNGGDWYDSKNLGPAGTIGLAQVAVLGAIGRVPGLAATEAPVTMGAAGRAIMAPGLPGWVARLGAGTATGMTGQQGIDLASHALGWGTSWGAVPDMLMGKEGGFKHFASQAVVFALFSAMHAHHAPKGAVDGVRTAAETYSKSFKGPEAEAAAEVGSQIFSDAMNGRLTPEAVEQMPEGPAKTLATEVVENTPAIKIVANKGMEAAEVVKPAPMSPGDAIVALGGGAKQGAAEQASRYAQRIIDGEKPEIVLEGLNPEGATAKATMARVAELRGEAKGTPQTPPAETSPPSEANALTPEEIVDLGVTAKKMGFGEKRPMTPKVEKMLTDAIVAQRNAPRGPQVIRPEVRPPEPEPDPEAKPEAAKSFVDVRSELAKDGGDSSVTARRLAAQMEAHLAKGGKVSYWHDGKETPITQIKDGMARDAEGKPWGILPLAMGKGGAKSGIEFKAAEAKAGPLTLKGGEEAGEMKGVGKSYRHAITDSAGEEVGSIIASDGGETVNITIAQGKIGTGSWRGLMKSLAEQYPNAKAVEFIRTTGPNAGKPQRINLPGRAKIGSAPPSGDPFEALAKHGILKEPAPEVKPEAATGQLGFRIADVNAPGYDNASELQFNPRTGNFEPPAPTAPRGTSAPEPPAESGVRPETLEQTPFIQEPAKPFTPLPEGDVTLYRWEASKKPEWLTEDVRPGEQGQWFGSDLAGLKQFKTPGSRLLKITLPSEVAEQFRQGETGFLVAKQYAESARASPSGEAAFDSTKGEMSPKSEPAMKPILTEQEFNARIDDTAKLTPRERLVLRKLVDGAVHRDILADPEFKALYKAGEKVPDKPGSISHLEKSALRKMGVDQKTVTEWRAANAEAEGKKIGKAPTIVDPEKMVFAPEERASLIKEIDNAEEAEVLHQRLQKEDQEFNAQYEKKINKITDPNELDAEAKAAKEELDELWERYGIEPDPVQPPAEQNARGETAAIPDKAAAEGTPRPQAESQEPAGRTPTPKDVQDASPGKVRPTAMGAAALGELTPDTSGVYRGETNLSNARIDAERLREGLNPIINSARMEDAEAWDQATRRLESNPGEGQRLIDEVIAKPRPLDTVEQAVLLREKIRLDSEFRSLYREWEAAKPGDKAALQAALEQMGDQRYEVALAAERTGSELGRSFRFRRVMAAEDYSLGSLAMREAIKRGRPLEPKELAELSKLSDKIKTLQDRLDEMEKIPEPPPEPPGKLGSRGIVDRVGDWLKGLFKAPEGKRSAGWEYADRMEKAAAKELTAKYGKDILFSGFDPQMIVPLAKYTAAKIIKGAYSFADFSKAIVGKFGDDIKPHVEDIWKQAEAIAREPEPSKQEVRVDLKNTKGQVKERFSKIDRENQTVPQKVFRNVGEGMNLARTLVTSMDLSAVLRQNMMFAFGRPLMTLRAIPESLRAFGSKRGADIAADTLSQRQNAPWYKRAGLFIAEAGGELTGQEEAYIGRMAKKIPGLAGSERSYTTFLNRMRADMFDSMTASLGKEGKATDAQAKVIANFVNVATGRGGLAGFEKAAVPLATVFFSPRFLTSRFQLLMGQPLWKGDAATRGAIAKEYARAAIGLALFYGAAKLALQDEAKITFDPRSTDFGKIVVGNTHIDPLAGLSQTMVLGGRIVSGEKVTGSGQVVPIRGKGVPYKGDNAWDLGARFARSKLAPVPGAMVNIASGTNAAGEPTTVQSTAANLAVPMSFRDVIEAMEDQGIPRGTAISILNIFGMGSQVYSKKKAGQR